MQEPTPRADAPDAALAAALGDGHVGDDLLTLGQLAARTGVPRALLRVAQRQGLLTPMLVDGQPRYTSDDAEAVTAGLALLDAGVPLGELLALARRHDTAMRALAEEAVELFARFVRDPIKGSAASDDEAAAQLVEAFRRMLPATRTAVAHHFGVVLTTTARERIAAARAQAP